MATATLRDFVKENPEHKTEGREDMRLLRSEKMGEHEAEIEKIKNIFVSILKDIKKDMEADAPQGTAATADFMKQMCEQWDEHILNLKRQKIVRENDVLRRDNFGKHH